MEPLVERQAGESTRAYQLFQLYCELGVGRSLTRVQQAYAQLTGRLISLRYLKRLSALYRWVERAALYDHQVQQIREQERHRIREAMTDLLCAVAQEMVTCIQNAIGTLTPQSIGELVKLIEALRLVLDLLPPAASHADIKGQVLDAERIGQLLELEARVYGARVG